MSLRTQRDTLARWDAENRIVERTGKLPPEARASTAAQAAKELLWRWEDQRSKMIKRDDPRNVLFLRSCAEIEATHAELDNLIATRPPSDSVAVRDVIEMVKHLPPEAAARVAIIATRYQAKWALID